MLPDCSAHTQQNYGCAWQLLCRAHTYALFKGTERRKVYTIEIKGALQQQQMHIQRATALKSCVHFHRAHFYAHNPGPRASPEAKGVASRQVAVWHILTFKRSVLVARRATSFGFSKQECAHMGVVLLCGSSIAGIIAVQCCITHIWSTGNAAKAALKFFFRKFRRCNFTLRYE